MLVAIYRCVPCLFEFALLLEDTDVDPPTAAYACPACTAWRERTPLRVFHSKSGRPALRGADWDHDWTADDESIPSQAPGEARSDLLPARSAERKWRPCLACHKVKVRAVCHGCHSNGAGPAT